MKSPRKAHAVDIYALNPDVSAEMVAKKVGVEVTTVYKWRKDPMFIDAIYKRYMLEFGGELPAVLNAMVREAKAGNVQAGRLVLEHSGKLVKNVNVTIDSPFEKWMSKVDNAEVVDGEIVEDDVEELIEVMPVIDTPLPPRNTESQRKRVGREKKKVRAIERDAKKKEKYLAQRRKWYQWAKRAKAVGVEPLPTKRPSKAQRKEWEDLIVRKEDEKKNL
tara:strand:- start:319 stop:975 length:657 start_codon:yes stop_codon:yes gene_type:complete